MSGAAGWVSGSAARLAHLHPAPARLYPPSGRELQRRGSGSASPLFQLAVFAGCPPLTVKGTLRGPTSPCGCPMSTDREVGGGRARSLGTARGYGQGMAGQQHSMTVRQQRKLGAAQPCLRPVHNHASGWWTRGGSTRGVLVSWRWHRAQAGRLCGSRPGVGQRRCRERGCGNGAGRRAPNRRR
jgi:hypothetical protein